MTESVPALFESPEDRQSEIDQSLPGFAEFWEAYPRKCGKPAARDAWRKQVMGRTRKGSVARGYEAGTAAVEDVMLGLRAWAAWWEHVSTEYHFLPHPATWLSQRRWENPPRQVQWSGPWQRALAAARERDGR